MIKKLLLSTFVCMGACAAKAQITITTADIATIGTVVRQAHDTLPDPSITPGAPGANVTWNFAALDTMQVDTMTFTNPAWTAYGSQFPSSNLAIQVASQGDSATIYLDNSSSGLYIIGQAAEGVSVQLNPQELLLPFPATMGTSFTGTSKFSADQPVTGTAGVDSARFSRTTTKTSEVDAWGTLTTPLGTFDVIRVSEMRIVTDSIFVHTTGPFPPAGWFFAESTQDTTYNFTWWANSVGFPLVEMDSTATGYKVRWLMATPTATSVNAIAGGSTLSVYPNPAHDVVNISMPSGEETQFVIYDVSGRAVEAKTISANVTSVLVDRLTPGIYFYTAATASGAIFKGKITITK